MAYRVESQKRGDREVLLLHDDSSGASASLLPSHGFNLFDLRLPAAGMPRPILSATPDFADRPRPGAGQGIPILFPFPNRIRGGAFEFRGRRYQLPLNNGPNAIHGFAVDVPWEVLEHKAGADSAFVVGRYQISRATPARLAQWPADAILEVRYDLSGRRLTMTTTVSNPTAEELPYGFGIHPYFRMPFPPDGDMNRTRVILPATRQWVLDRFLPTGEVRPVEARLDFREGRPMAGLKLDDVLTGLEPAASGTGCVCRLVDEAKGAEFRLGFDRSFRELVVYTPPDRPGVISLEPYTQMTDAINLAARGVDGGLRVLGHGGRDVLAITMETLG